MARKVAHRSAVKRLASAVARSPSRSPAKSPAKTVALPARKLNFVEVYTHLRAKYPSLPIKLPKKGTKNYRDLRALYDKHCAKYP